MATGSPTKSARTLPMVLTTAAAAVAVSVLAAASVADAKSCEFVPIHRILASAGGVYKMEDGRELKGTKVNVGGCTTMPALPTGLAYPDSSSNYTVVSHENDAKCVTGTGRDGKMPTYKGFQAILVEANGFKFSADLVLEDIDAQPVENPADGWRETMSSLAMADGAVVRPIMTTKKGSLVAVQQFRMPGESLKEVGFPGSDLLIDGAAYSSWTETKNCPFMNDPTGQCKAFVTYPEPIDRLLIIYSITQPSANDPNAAAFFSEVTLGCGCQCGAKAAQPTTTVPVDGKPGQCKSEPNKMPSYSCDFMGKYWCETKETTKWAMTGSGPGACAQVPSMISKPVSSYTPSKEFSRLPEP